MVIDLCWQNMDYQNIYWLMNKLLSLDLWCVYCNGNLFEFPNRGDRCPHCNEPLYGKDGIRNFGAFSSNKR